MSPNQLCVAVLHHSEIDLQMFADGGQVGGHCRSKSVQVALAVGQHQGNKH